MKKGQDMTAQASVSVTDASPLTLHFIGNLLTFHVRSAETGGKVTLIENRTMAGQGSPPHRQSDEEIFYVLEGQYEFFLNGERFLKGVGEAMHIAPGTIHAFRNPGPGEARMLIVNAPGGLHEGFFMEVGEDVAAGITGFPPLAPPDVPKIIASAMKHEIEILPPAAG
jgi:quercetin dioxygenase-like cupin family protein